MGGFRGGGSGTLRGLLLELGQLDMELDDLCISLIERDDLGGSSRFSHERRVEPGMSSFGNRSASPVLTMACRIR